MNDFAPITPESVAAIRAFLEAAEKIDALAVHLPAHRVDQIRAIRHALFDAVFGVEQ
ncbi:MULTISPECIES: hypothetical protein [unclassified Acidovorax]|uniref:hypothetical protein n=1 Tax=unclassified Acidovorax TaxID=2684926 RepID=UPI0012FAA847|nr:MULTISPECIES: hypothetical protein [unclassified Acidovorax]